MKARFFQPLLKHLLALEPEVPPLVLSWILPNRLAVGGLPRSQDLEIFRQTQIRAILSLCAMAEGILPEVLQADLHCQHFFLPDSRYPEKLQVERLAQAVQILHQALSQQQRVYIHCLAGVERSPTVCIAYLCQHHHLPLWEAINFVKQAHPMTRLAEPQLEALKQFVRQLPQSENLV